MHTRGVGALVSTRIVFCTIAERPSSRSATRSRYCPSGTTFPSSSFPSQLVRRHLFGCIGTESIRRRTRSPSRFTTSTVASSATLMTNAMSLTSFFPSPLGEKYRVIWGTLMTGGSLLSRWATKNAANVESTRITNVTRATNGIAAALAGGGLVLANDRDHVPIAVFHLGDGRGLGGLVELGDPFDAQDLGDLFGGGLVTAGVHHGGRRRLVGLAEIADRDVAVGIAVRDEQVLVRLREAGLAAWR